MLLPAWPSRNIKNLNQGYSHTIQDSCSGDQVQGRAVPCTATANHVSKLWQVRKVKLKIGLRILFPSFEPV